MEHPKDYRKNLENKSIEYLILERNRLIRSMEQFENNELPEEEYYEEPNPATIYMYDYLYLAEICDLVSKKISDKFNKKETMWDFDDLR